MFEGNKYFSMKPLSPRKLKRLSRLLEKEENETLKDKVMQVKHEYLFAINCGIFDMDLSVILRFYIDTQKLFVFKKNYEI